MTSGIQLKELAVGTGALAERGKVAVVHLRSFLNRGEERLNTYTQNQPAHIHLGKRESIAGLEQGIEGMRAGGRRELIISPHLAYGKNGVPGSIPPNAVLRFEVELLEVRDQGVSKPEDFPPGKQLIVLRPGEAARNIAKWQLGVWETGRAGVSVQKVPPNGATWRHMPHVEIAIELSPDETRSIFENVLSIPQNFPAEIIVPDEVGVDTSEKANSIPRHSKTNVPCLAVTIWERGMVLFHYYLREDSPALLSSKFYIVSSKAVDNYLASKKSLSA